MWLIWQIAASPPAPSVTLDSAPPKDKAHAKWGLIDK
jgi:hypothetical protein